jgi:hypothetical protein
MDYRSSPSEQTSSIRSQLIQGSGSDNGMCSLAPVVAQLHSSLQRCVKGLEDRPGNSVERRASQFFHPCSGASGQTTVAAGRAAPR